MEILVTETNRYGKEYFAEWEDITLDVLKAHFCVVLILSLYNFRESIGDIWSSSWITRHEGICKIFPRNLSSLNIFKKLWQNFHKQLYYFSYKV